MPRSHGHRLVQKKTRKQKWTIPTETPDFIGPFEGPWLVAASARPTLGLKLAPGYVTLFSC